MNSMLNSSMDLYSMLFMWWCREGVVNFGMVFVCFVLVRVE